MSLRLAEWSLQPEDRQQRAQESLNDLLGKLSPDAKRFLEAHLKTSVEGDARNAQRRVFEADYLQIPAKIEQFVFDPYFLGRTLRTNVFKRIVDDLVELFDGEYSEVLLKGAIGWGKSVMAEIGILYDIYREWKVRACILSS